MRRLHHRVREDYIFEFATEVNEKTTNEIDDVLECNYMTKNVKMINGKTICIKSEGKQTAAIISDEVERRSSIPRDVTCFVHQGKVMNEKKTTEENNIGTEATLEMSLRLLGRMEKNEQMDTQETEDDRRRKKEVGGRERRKDDETKLKMESYSRKADEKIESFSRKSDEMMEKFLQNHEFSRNSNPRDELTHRENERRR